MATVKIDVRDVEKVVLDRMAEKLEDGWNIVGYVNASVMMNRQSSSFIALVPEAVDNLVARGELETTGVATEIRLPGRVAVDRILLDGMVSKWMLSVSALGCKRAIRQTGTLLLEHAEYALDLDPERAFMAAVAAAGVNTYSAEASDEGYRALQRTALGHRGGTLDPVSLLKTLISMRDFTGDAAELVDTALAVVTEVAA